MLRMYLLTTLWQLLNVGSYTMTFIPYHEVNYVLFWLRFLIIDKNTLFPYQETYVDHFKLDIAAEENEFNVLRDKVEGDCNANYKD